MRFPTEITHTLAVPLVAYLLTFSTYGTHLPGSEKGWIDAQHRIPGSPVLRPDHTLVRYWQGRLNNPPWMLDTRRRLMTLQTILSVCTHRLWIAHAAHVRTTHVHAVVSGSVKPERMVADFKAYSARAFRSQATDAPPRRYWAKHGSTRYLWNQASLKAAIEYVVDGQGARMACYVASVDHPCTIETEPGA